VNRGFIKQKCSSHLLEFANAVLVPLWDVQTPNKQTCKLNTLYTSYSLQQCLCTNIKEKNTETNLCGFAFGGLMVKNLRELVSEYEHVEIERKPT